MNRRIFLEKAMLMGVGALTLLKGTNPWGKELITEALAAEPPFPSQDVLLLPPFEKNSPFPLERALTERKTTRSYDPGRTWKSAASGKTFFWRPPPWAWGPASSPI